MENKEQHIIKGSKRWIAIGIHVIIWLAVFLLPYLLQYEQPRKGQSQPPHLEYRDLNTLTKFLWLALFYFNAFILVPRLVYKRKFLSYTVSLISIFSVIMLVHGLLFHLMIDREFHLGLSSAFNLVPFILTLVVSTAYQSVSDQLKTERILAEKQNEHLKTELSFLRSQISPHFLFNVMNNIVALVRLKSNELEPTVVKLSTLLQYMLYESDEEKVLLKSEVEYLQSYIDLQQQRFGKELTLNTAFHVKEEWHAIEPMLLIPFVENAFKHGNGALLNPEISIDLSVSDSQLHFIVKNKFVDSTEIKDKTSGIGLINVTRRLELLYPGKHELLVVKENGYFMIDLKALLQ